MTRRRFVWSDAEQRLVEVDLSYRSEPRAPMVIPDLPGYQSPVTGLWVEGRKARREDLKRTGSRPWEGMASERREAERQRQYAEKQADSRLEGAVRRAYLGLSPEKRRILESGK